MKAIKLSFGNQLNKFLRSNIKKTKSKLLINK
jgi:hypothetical protein